ncbi:UDP-4-amino-4,6-dideoxy-N-acetyl-beta-L-altrosamine transaminase [Legionella impletisoli]|uniref:UDP-4-amino-4, 6-dideoxy-N-acetyl-beta-L-altrosamine transaminase n=1 Tax=Legionella impletisoli TaxID=343510 RepID=A0A917JSE0_9GAMM|nr:UDP-4-amino-4,6-dideoxy-N-acetyl-beta-L-altrosamine transaminase [Legionella impletisoli]GGI82198.1 UDP-4-amino-4,6-dideoxy-N-acetyl-beta-L-altrosamine transaminase [Legionella impletisoli]
MIPYGKQEINAADISAVLEVLKSDWLTQGPVIPKFEEAIANKVNANYGVATNSATSALHIACLSLGLGQGDLVWTSPISFVASANCALYCGADVDFVDIDSNTLNMSIEALSVKLKEADRLGKLPKIVIPVHFAGQSCDMESIYQLSQQYGFRIIEDASHAIGGAYKNTSVGSCTYSDISVFSFHPVKIITSGEGGIALTNDKKLAEKMRRLRSHGITKNQDDMVELPEGAWKYEQLELGFNYRITDIHAALGLSQLARLDQIIERRNFLASIYNHAFSSSEILFQILIKDVVSAWHLYVIRVPESKRSELFNKLQDEGVGVNVHYIPIHTQPYYKKLGFVKGQYPIAEQYYREAITLPLFPQLTEEQQNFIIKTTKSVFN